MLAAQLCKHITCFLFLKKILFFILLVDLQYYDGRSIGECIIFSKEGEPWHHSEVVLFQVTTAITILGGVKLTRNDRINFIICKSNVAYIDLSHTLNWWGPFAIGLPYFYGFSRLSELRTCMRNYS